MGHEHAEAELAHHLWAGLREHDARRIANVLGLSVSSVYKASEGGVPIPAWWLPKIFHATGDVVLYAKLAGVEEAGLVLSHSATSPAMAKSIERAALGLAAETGRVVELVDDAIEDRKISAAELSALKQELDQLERKAAELRRVLGIAGAA